MRGTVGAERAGTFVSRANGPQCKEFGLCYDILWKKRSTIIDRVTISLHPLLPIPKIPPPFEY